MITDLRPLRLALPLVAPEWVGVLSDTLRLVHPWGLRFGDCSLTPPRVDLF